MQFAIESWNGRAIVFFRAVASVGVIGICFGGDTGRQPPWFNFLVLEGFTGGGRLRLGVYDCWVSTRRPSARLLSSLICSSEDSK